MDRQVASNLVELPMPAEWTPARPREATRLQIARLAKVCRLMRGGRSLSALLNDLVFGIQELVGFRVVVLSMLDEGDPAGSLRPVAAAGVRSGRLELFRNQSWRWSHISRYLRSEFAYGSVYFVPANTKDLDSIEAAGRESPKLFLETKVSQENQPPAKNGHAAQRSCNEWQSGDRLLIPLYQSDQLPMGLISLDGPADGQRPDATSIHLLEILTSQAASAIQNARLIRRDQDRTEAVTCLVRANQDITGQLDQSAIFSTMAEHIVEMVDASRCSVYELKQLSEQLVLTAESHASLQAEERPTGAEFDPSRWSEIHRIISEQRPAVYVYENGEYAARRAVALLPLTIRGELFGVVEVVSRQSQGAYGREDLQLVTAVIGQASVTLENARLFQDTFQRERFFAALGRVILAINATADLPVVLDLICQESLSLFNVDGAYIWQMETGQLIGIAAQGHAAKEFRGAVVPLTDEDDFAATVASRKQGTFSNGFRHNSGINLRMPPKASTESVLGIPLNSEDDIIGVLILVDTKDPERFQHQDLEQATLFAVQAAIAIQNAELVTDLRDLNEQLDERVIERTKALGQERDRVKYLLRITAELTSSLDQDRVLTQALELVNEAVNATHGSILLVDPESGELHYPDAFNMYGLPSFRAIDLGLRHDEGIANWIIENRSAVIIGDLSQDSRWDSQTAGPSLHSLLAVPLISGGDVIGIMMLLHEEPQAFTQEQLELVEAAAMQVANAINNAQLFLLIRDQAERLGVMLREEHIESAKNQAILESIADGVLVADESGRIVLANESAGRILEIPRSELMTKPVKELLKLYGEAGASWAKTFDSWASGTSRGGKSHFASGKLILGQSVVSIHLSPVVAGGQFFGTVSILRDVTKEVEVDRMKSEFVSTVSHELRTPMTSIIGYVELMFMGATGTLTEKQNRYLGIIRNNANRMTMLVNDLLDISRIESGKTRLELSSLDLTQIINQVVEVHLRGRIEHDEKPINASVEIPSPMPLVTADQARVTQILTNLVDNAFNYTPAEGTIRVSASVNGRFLNVSVSDTGVGIKEENQERIFERFFRSDSEIIQGVPGTGLGLAIVRSLVEMHGGEIEVDSTLGRGSTFTFGLPLATEDGD